MSASMDDRTTEQSARDARGVAAVGWFLRQSPELRAQINDVIWAFTMGSWQGIERGLALALEEWEELMEERADERAGLLVLAQVAWDQSYADGKVDAPWDESE